MLHQILFVPTFIFLGPLSFHRLRPLPIHGFYSAKLRIRRGAPDWVKRGLNSKNQKQNVAKLEDTLMNNWRELDRMLVCSKISICAYRYKKNFQMGQVSVMANLIQSLTITLYQIKDIINKLRQFKNIPN